MISAMGQEFSERKEVWERFENVMPFISSMASYQPDQI